MTQNEFESEGDTFASIYARTSSPNQRNNYSIDEQINECRKYCAQRGWPIRYVFVDHCQSGRSVDRPKFQLMLEKAKSREFAVIVVWKLDRFCRSLVDLVNVEKMLRTSEVELCSVTEFVDTTTSVGRFNYRSLASVAELERELIGERARLGLYALARENRWPNSYPPLGYKKDSDGRLHVVTSEAKLVNKIFHEYFKKKSMPEVAYQLNSNSIGTKRGSKRDWNARAVRGILANKIYIGEYTVAGFTAHIDAVRIVDDQLFNKTQQIMARYNEPGAKRAAMPLHRKIAKVEKICERYQEFLETLACCS